LENGYLVAEISSTEGVLAAITNKLTGRRYTLVDDQVGVTMKDEAGMEFTWLARPSGVRHFSAAVDRRAEAATLTLTDIVGEMHIAICYTLRQDQFWIQRRIVVTSSKPQTRFDRLIYGKLAVPKVQPHILKLGKFDKPRLLSKENGGVFAGVAWWFYDVTEDGLYQNADMKYTTAGSFESEPWYVGVFQTEPGEPYPGWLWYKTFLQMRKDEYDKQKSWSYWNAGWGQWGIEVNDPAAPSYIELMHEMGVRGVCFGSGETGIGLDKSVELARTDANVRNSLKSTAKDHLAAGFLVTGKYEDKKWDDTRTVEAKINRIDEAISAGFHAFHFDFFSTVDSFTAHRNVARYFRAAREKLDYTECHLGMADYGPQFQREVLVNHPTDLEGFDISRFSSDWATFLGFRHSRRGWQSRYDGLMPECGLYYFLTHYSNWGHPRRYLDPEPQQLLYRCHAYCGIAYNFHDRIGFRDSLAAAAAFTPYYAFGHVELKMPQQDVAFARDYLRWVADNAEILRWGRVCLETDDVCVMSKLRDGRGAIFLLNYSPGKRGFHLQPETGASGNLEIRQVYPERKEAMKAQDGENATLTVSGESVLILEVNHGLKSLPPENPGRHFIDLTDWKSAGSGWQTEFTLPDIRSALSAAKDPTLPQEILSIDQLPQPASGAKGDSLVTVVGLGPLPDAFLKLYGFREGKFVSTAKLAPWAYADRVWLVYRPAHPPRMTEQLPQLKVNGQKIRLTPRVDYRSGKDATKWILPLFYADMTENLHDGAVNTVVLSGLNEAQPANCYIVSQVDLDRSEKQETTKGAGH
jgi:hypothetical protein